jgi:hypothetical protein
MVVNHPRRRTRFNGLGLGSGQRLETRAQSPGADPHARWCGRGPGATRAPIPIPSSARSGVPLACQPHRHKTLQRSSRLGDSARCRLLTLKSQPVSHLTMDRVALQNHQHLGRRECHTTPWSAHCVPRGWLQFSVDRGNEGGVVARGDQVRDIPIDGSAAPGAPSCLRSLNYPVCS